MHWFWRAAFAVIPGGFLGLWIQFSLIQHNGPWWLLFDKTSDGPLVLVVILVLVTLPIAVSHASRHCTMAERRLAA